MRKYIGTFLVLIAALSWSTAGLFTRVVSTDIPTTLFWRSLIGGLCVLIIYLTPRIGNKGKNVFAFSIGELIIAALSTLGMICFISAFFFTSIANVSFTYGTMPLATYLLALIFLNERLHVITSICCVLSAIGMFIIAYGNSDLNDYWGILLAFGMTFFMASLTVAAKYFPNANSIKATYLSAFLGAVIALPFSSFSSVTLQDYLFLGMFGVVNVGLGFGVYLYGVRMVNALTAALVGLFEIPLAPFWGWLLFGETPNITVIIGGVIIIASAILYIVKTETA